jgi:hypothetical protein
LLDTLAKAAATERDARSRRKNRESAIHDPSRKLTVDRCDPDVSQTRLRSIPTNVVGNQDEARAAWEALRAVVKQRGDKRSVEAKAPGRTEDAAAPQLVRSDKRRPV